MRVAVVGGKLQGLEACYLAKKAGWEVILIDKKPYVPAAGLCDKFCVLDVNRLMDYISVLKGIDLIVPALENPEALGTITRVAKYVKVPLIFHPQAYRVSSSKLDSNKLFRELGIPTPKAWPECGFPSIAKPSGASGSEGVVKIADYEQFLRFADSPDSRVDWVIEEYLEGPSYSIEVIGFNGCFKVLQVTELVMDAVYDCKRVLAPVSISSKIIKEFEQMALTLARSLNLTGIMDVEVILHNGRLKILEIDARLPSQTPTAVFKSTGVNLLEKLGHAFINGRVWDEFTVKETRGVIFEHIKVSNDKMEITGEHILSESGPLTLLQGLFGADEMITDYLPGKTHWAATLIVTGSDLKDAWEKRCVVIRRISEEIGITQFSDPVPPLENSQNTGTGLGGYYDEIA